MRYCFAVLILALSGCAVVPENIHIADETRLVSYEQVISTGESSLTKPARWGGIIAQIENKENVTFVEVVHFPLNGYGRPAVANESIGRFKVKVDGFLDPVVFENGRSITFIGKVDQPLEGAVGEQPYVYPTLQGDSYHLWRKRTEYDVSNVQFNNQLGWFGPGWGGPFWGGPFWGGHRFGFGPWGWGPGIQRSRVRVTERAPKSNPNTRAYHGNKRAPNAPLQKQK